MCTAVSFTGCGHFFGRNLDLDHSYDERVTITPRNYPFHFHRVGDLNHHYAMIGMAFIAEGYPLYYDATNEKGLSMAGLNFTRSAVYYPAQEGLDNVAAFEFIPWILGQCADLAEARTLLDRIRITDESFSEALPYARLHWLVADKTGSLVVESTADGLRIYDNPTNVMANEPPFPFHMYNLVGHMNLTAQVPENRFSQALDLKPYGVGIGSVGLPGDLSPASRFVRAAFTRLNAQPGDTPEESIGQMFHILGSVEQIRGCVDLGNGRYETTFYSSCCDTERGIYYYVTYYNRQITGVDMHGADLDSAELVSFPLVKGQQIRMEN